MVFHKEYFIRQSPIVGYTACFQSEQTSLSSDPLELPVTVPSHPHQSCYLQQTPRESLSGHRRQRHRSSCWHSRSPGPPESLSCCCPAEDRERWGRLSSLADSTITDSQTSELRMQAGQNRTMIKASVVSCFTLFQALC